MSHLTQVELKVKDLDALEEAARECGMELDREADSFLWYQGKGKCHAVLRDASGKEGAYEIGLVRQPDGSYITRFDTYGPGAWIRTKAGEKLEILEQEYSVAVAVNRANMTLARHGWRVQRQQIPNSTTVRLELQRARPR